MRKKVLGLLLLLSVLHTILYLLPSWIFHPILQSHWAHHWDPLRSSYLRMEFWQEHREIYPSFLFALLFSAFLQGALMLLATGGLIGLVLKKPGSFWQRGLKFFPLFLALILLITLSALAIAGISGAMFSFLVAPHLGFHPQDERLFHLKWMVPLGVFMVCFMIGKIWGDATRVVWVDFPYLSWKKVFQVGWQRFSSHWMLRTLLFLLMVGIHGGLTLISLPSYPYLLATWVVTFLYWSALGSLHQHALI